MTRSIKGRKKWGVFIYACGNNDLEPEITRSVNALFGAIPCAEAAVAVQLARAPMETVALLRPGSANSFTFEGWHGVRRYILDDKNIDNSLVKNSSVEELGNVNMADPSSLADFLDWAFAKIEAREYMVILSGHGAGFVGAMADFTHGRPQIMGIPQMAEAIKKSAGRAGKKFKFLIMDACYMNLLENTYEFALSGVADIFIGSSGLIPLEGYDYIKLIGRLYRLSPFGAKEDFERKFKIPEDIGAAGITLNKRLFKAVKQKLSCLAEKLICLGINPNEINNSEELLVEFNTILSIIKNLSNADSLVKYVSDILSLSDKLYLQNRKTTTEQNAINIFCPALRGDFDFLAKYYLSLAFTRNNLWPQWLAGSGVDRLSDIKGSLSFRSFTPLPLPLGLLSQHLLSINPQLNVKDINRTYLQLGWVKNDS
jgi:hypothetical protein